jgi:hypothetical protein
LASEVAGAFARIGDRDRRKGVDADHASRKPRCGWPFSSKDVFAEG